MFDLNRPLHAYDADKIDEGIIVRNSKKDEKFKALDDKDYNLEEGMCVITDASGVLGLGGNNWRNKICNRTRYKKCVN